MLDNKGHIKAVHKEYQLLKQAKWDRFREERTNVVNKYIEMKKRSQALRKLLVLVCMHGFMKVSINAIQVYKDYRSLKFHGAKLALMISLKFGRRIRQQGGIDRLIQQRIKQSLSFWCLMLTPRFLETEVHGPIGWFFFRKQFCEEVQHKVRVTRAKVMVI